MPVPLCHCRVVNGHQNANGPDDGEEGLGLGETATNSVSVFHAAASGVQRELSSPGQQTFKPPADKAASRIKKVRKTARWWTEIRPGT
jgi:hypothetical protein